MTFEYWYMLHAAVLIATVAMASGVEGATFFTPLFLLVLGLDPDVAIGAGLITEVFGFASGVTAYVRRRLIDYRLAGMLLVATLPAAVVGTWLGTRVDARILKVLLGAVLLALAWSFLRGAAVEGDGVAAGAGKGDRKGIDRSVVTSQGERIRYTVRRRGEGMLLAGIGATFLGMVSMGLGELTGYFLLRRSRIPSRVAVATTVLIVAVTALAAAAGHVVHIVRTGEEALGTVLSLCVFTVPGVIVGGQIGPALASRISQHALERGLGFLFLVVGALMVGEAALP